MLNNIPLNTSGTFAVFLTRVLSTVNTGIRAWDERGRTYEARLSASPHTDQWSEYCGVEYELTNI